MAYLPNTNSKFLQSLSHAQLPPTEQNHHVLFLCLSAEPREQGNNPETGKLQRQPDKQTTYGLMEQPETTGMRIQTILFCPNL